MFTAAIIFGCIFAFLFPIFQIHATISYNDAINPTHLINIHAHLPEICPRKLNLPHQLLIRHRHIIEREHPPAQLEQQIRAEGDEGPERELQIEELARSDRFWLSQIWGRQEMVVGSGEENLALVTPHGGRLEFERERA